MRCEALEVPDKLGGFVVSHLLKHEELADSFP
jgi:hypothetical protein